MAKNPRLIDLRGKRFGMWLVGDQAGNSKGGGSLWNAVCDCGKRKIVRGGDLRHGKSKNCGCLKADRIKYLHLTHGETGTRLYYIWQNMRARTTNRKSSSFKDYGGRGINV